MKGRTETLAELETRCEDNPASLAFARLAEACAESGDDDRAVSVCINGLKRYPNYSTARLVLGKCLLKLGRLEEAATEFRRACRVDRRSPAAFRLLADTLVKQRRTDIAGNIYAYLLENDPDSPELKTLSDQTPGHVPFDILQIALAAPTSAAETPVPQAPAAFEETSVPQDTQAAAPIPQAPVAHMPAPVPAPAPSPAPAPAQADSDDDVINLDSLTPPGGTRLGPVGTKAPTTPPTRADVQAYTNLIESAETIALTPSALGGQGEVTGQDIFTRIDSMFGEEEPPAQDQAPREEPAQSDDPLTALFATGQVKGGTLDTGRFRMADIPSEQIKPIALGGADVPIDSDAFGATMAFESPLLEEAALGGAPAESHAVSEEPQQSAQPSPSGVQAPVSAPTGADVSNRLDELFDRDADETWQPVPPPAAQPQEPLVGFAAHSIDTAVSPDAALAGDITAQFGGQTQPIPADTNQTAMFITGDSSNTTEQLLETAEQTAAFLGDDTQQTASFEAPAPDTHTPLPDPQDPQTAVFESPAAMLDSMFAQTEQAAPLVLDQEMSFGADTSQQQAIEDVMTAAFDVRDIQRQTAEPEQSATSTEGGLFALPPTDDQTGMFEQPAADTEHAGTQELFAGDTHQAQSAATVPAATEGDIFADTWIGSEQELANQQMPATLQEQSEKAQTLAFARDELDDMIAIEEDSKQIDRRGDTTTIKPLTALDDETEQVEQQTASFQPQQSAGYQEVIFEEPAEQSKAPTERFERPADRTGHTQSTLLNDDILNARTTQLDRNQVVAPRQSPAQGPIESYAQEISQAQTLVFRRDDLDQLTETQAPVEASREEQDALNRQISQAHTVEFSRDELPKLGAFEPPQPPSQDLSMTTTARVEDTLGMVETDAIFLDDTLSEGQSPFQEPSEVTPPPAPAQVSPPPRAPAPPRHQPPAHAVDPFLAETIADPTAFVEPPAVPPRPARQNVPQPPPTVSIAPPPNALLFETSQEQIEQVSDETSLYANEPSPVPPKAAAPRPSAPPAPTFDPDKTAVSKRPPEPPLADTIKMMPLDEPGADLVWEDVPVTHIDLTVTETEGKPRFTVSKRPPEGDFEDTVQMDVEMLRLRKLIEQTEMMSKQAQSEQSPPAQPPAPPPEIPTFQAPPTMRAAELKPLAPALEPDTASDDVEEPGEEQTAAVSDSEARAQAADQLASIPDHVLTPTLADIYFHQGQPYLAIQIYKRLLQLQPENVRLSERIAMIERNVATGATVEPAAPAPASPAPRTQPEPSAPATPRRRRTTAAATDSPATPLRGTRLKREVREHHRRKRSSRRS